MRYLCRPPCLTQRFDACCDGAEHGDQQGLAPVRRRVSQQIGKVDEEARILAEPEYGTLEKSG